MPNLGTNFQANLLTKISGGAWTPPTTVWFGLFTVSPTWVSAGTEVTGNNYSRVSLACNTTNFSAPVSGQISNAVPITFPTPSSSWGSIVAIGIFTAQTAGELLMFGPMMPSSMSVVSGIAPVLEANLLTIKLGP